jgi:hypothetical protein
MLMPAWRSGSAYSRLALHERFATDQVGHREPPGQVSAFRGGPAPDIGRATRGKGNAIAVS